MQATFGQVGLTIRTVSQSAPITVLCYERAAYGATFGQSRASIAEIVAMGGDADASVTAWLDAQMASRHRRRRAASPRSVFLGGTYYGCRQKCDREG
jgi:hypothetical protein